MQKKETTMPFLKYKISQAVTCRVSHHTVGYRASYSPSKRQSGHFSQHSNSSCTVCFSICLLLWVHVCNQARGVAKGLNCRLPRSHSSLFAPRQKQISQFVWVFKFLGIAPVNWYSWNFSTGLAVSQSRDTGRLTALMAIKISGRMLTLEKATGDGRGWKREFTT